MSKKYDKEVTELARDLISISREESLNSITDKGLPNDGENFNKISANGLKTLEKNDGIVKSIEGIYKLCQ